MHVGVGVGDSVFVQLSLKLESQCASAADAVGYTPPAKLEVHRPSAKLSWSSANTDHGHTPSCVGETPARRAVLQPHHLLANVSHQYHFTGAVDLHFSYFFNFRLRGNRVIPLKYSCQRVTTRGDNHKSLRYPPQP